MTDTPAQSLPPSKIAFIIDGKVQDILHTDERLAAIFLSNPTIIDISDMLDSEGLLTVRVKATYNSETGEFINEPLGE